MVRGVNRSLEIKLQCELDDSRVFRRKNLSSLRRVHVRVGIVEVRVVEDIEELRSELQVATLADMEVL